MKIYGWGRYPKREGKILLPNSRHDFLHHLHAHNNLIVRGLGRSYGDSATSSKIIQSTFLDHFIKFDNLAGIITCESGISLNQITEVTLPKGWFLPVTPGTSHVTLGGAIASDVHGKNHHINGTISQYILSFELMLGTGEIINVSKTNHPELFHATCGGMGLTGAILSASLQLIKVCSTNMIQTTLKANCLDEVCQLFDENILSPYSVAWVDCMASKRNLGRSLLMLGQHTNDNLFSLPPVKKVNIPIDMPSFLLNKYSIRSFNSLYYHKEIFKHSNRTLPLTSFFYPLDSISNWNLLYGKKGFIQYQFVIPKEAGARELKKILSVIVDSGKGSFLAVLKIFGPANKNLLSFPIEGYTLALDFKISADVIALAEKLDAMIKNLGGRIYLTKDALMSESTFKATYPKWEIFEEVREKYGATGKFSSHQSIRLGLR